MKHFNKLRAPLYSIHEYPSLKDQEKRFKNAGWNQAQARNLWDLWSDDKFLSGSLRSSLDAVEPFDEWEEFALFASHYFLLTASTRQPAAYTTLEQTEKLYSRHSTFCPFVLLPQCPSGSDQRKYGAVVPDSEDSVGYHGGLGRQSRLASTDLYASSGDISNPFHPFPPRNIPARMSHTVTPLAGNDCILVGGRASPASALKDCWLRQANVWRPAHNLPASRFRHSASNVTINGNIQKVIVYGGKSSNGNTLDSWLQWDEGSGWQALEAVGAGSKPAARFGACMVNITETSGVMFGGIGQDGTILQDFWTWKTCCRSDGSLFVELSNRTEIMRSAMPLFQYINRFGATVNNTSWGLAIIGGIIPRQTLPLDKEIMLLDAIELLRCLDSTAPLAPTVVSAVGLGAEFTGRRPLLIGHASCAVNPNQVLILGGGAVCFSFGTFWNEGAWLLNHADSRVTNTWFMMPEIAETAKDVIEPVPGLESERSGKVETMPIPRVRVETAFQFQQVVAAGKPVVIEGCDIGPCTSLWTKEYMINAVGRDRKVWLASSFFVLGNILTEPN